MELFQYAIYFNDNSKPWANLAHHHKWVDDQLQVYTDDERLIDWFSAHRVKRIDVSEWDDDTGAGPVFMRVEDRLLATT